MEHGHKPASTRRRVAMTTRAAVVLAVVLALGSVLGAASGAAPRASADDVLNWNYGGVSCPTPNCEEYQ